jgi:hypothetical protein
VTCAVPTKSSPGRSPDASPGSLPSRWSTAATEVIIGVARERVFGPVVVSGLGGVATEVLSDHTARLAPLTGAGGLLRSVRAAPLLPGHRGVPAAGLTALGDTVLRVSWLAGDLGSRCGPPRRQLP